MEKHFYICEVFHENYIYYKYKQKYLNDYTKQIFED